MIPSVLTRQFRQGVEDFLHTTFPITTPFFHGLLERLLQTVRGGDPGQKRVNHHQLWKTQ